MANKHKSLFRPFNYHPKTRNGAKVKLGKRAPWYNISLTGEKKFGGHSTARKTIIAHLLKDGYTRINSRNFFKDTSRVLVLSRK